MNGVLDPDSIVVAQSQTVFMPHKPYWYFQDIRLVFSFCDELEYEQGTLEHVRRFFGLLGFSDRTFPGAPAEAPVLTARRRGRIWTGVMDPDTASAKPTLRFS